MLVLEGLVGLHRTFGISGWIIDLNYCDNEWFSGFLRFLQFKSELAIRSSWSEPQSAPGLVFADFIELLHLWLQRI